MYRDVRNPPECVGGIAVTVQNQRACCRGHVFSPFEEGAWTTVPIRLELGSTCMSIEQPLGP